jgi:hypothetical protein
MVSLYTTVPGIPVLSCLSVQMGSHNKFELLDDDVRLIRDKEALEKKRVQQCLVREQKLCQKGEQRLRREQIQFAARQHTWDEFGCYPAQMGIYEWEDENGNLHHTEYEIGDYYANELRLERLDSTFRHQDLRWQREMEEMEMEHLESRLLQADYDRPETDVSPTVRVTVSSYETKRKEKRARKNDAKSQIRPRKKKHITKRKNTTVDQLMKVDGRVVSDYVDEDDSFKRSGGEILGWQKWCGHTWCASRCGWY